MNWKIEYGNDTGDNDDTFFEWWEVSNGERAFKCDSEKDAIWLLDILKNVTHE